MASVNAIVQRKRSEEALKESEKELRRLSSELLSAQEAERMRISKELHDELGQALTLVKMRLGLVEMGLADDQEELREHCASASSHVDQVIEGARRLSRDLCPALLEDLGVTAALKRLVSDSAKASGVGILADMDNIDHLCSPHSAILLYRVVQEMLTNVMKHSKATEVNISARRREGQVVFEIQDNGIGMDLEEVESGRKTGGRGMGLAIMRERVRSLGGSLEIWSRRGMGTGLKFSLPTGGQGGLW
jgi:two-component system sensor histidine kinase UhpB